MASKPPEPSATQTHEPKTKVAPWGGTMVLKAKVAIELADELAESPTRRASYRCLSPSLLRDTLSSRIVDRVDCSGTRWCEEYKNLDRFGPRGA